MEGTSLHPSTLENIQDRINHLDRKVAEAKAKQAKNARRLAKVIKKHAVLRCMLNSRVSTVTSSATESPAIIIPPAIESCAGVSSANEASAGRDPHIRVLVNSSPHVRSLSCRSPVTVPSILKETSANKLVAFNSSGANSSVNRPLANRPKSIRFSVFNPPAVMYSPLMPPARMFTVAKYDPLSRTENVMALGSEVEGMDFQHEQVAVRVCVSRSARGEKRHMIDVMKPVSRGRSASPCACANNVARITRNEEDDDALLKAQFESESNRPFKMHLAATTSESAAPSSPSPRLTSYSIRDSKGRFARKREAFSSSYSATPPLSASPQCPRALQPEAQKEERDKEKNKRECDKEDTASHDVCKKRRLSKRVI